MSQPLVLAIEPDVRQAAIVKRIVREQALADVAVVDTRDAAVEMMRTTMPDVLLLSALMSPRDEDELINHLRTLDNAGHLQTHTIPQLASALGPAERSMARGLFSAFRRKKEQDPAAVGGCDPDLFAEEIRVYLQRAADRKRELADAGPGAAVRVGARATESKKTAAASTEDNSAADTSSSWESPFEWKPTASRSAPPPAKVSAPEPANEPFEMEPYTPEPAIAETAYTEPEPAFVEPLLQEPVHAQPADDLPLIVRPAEEPSVLQGPIIPEPGTVVEPLILSEPMFPPEPSIDAPHKVAAAAPADPWVTHTPQFVDVDAVIEPQRPIFAEAPVVDEPVIDEPYVDFDPVIEVVSDAPAFDEPQEPVFARDRHEALAIDLDATPEEAAPAPVSAVHQRAVKIVARVQDEQPDGDEWTRPQPVRVTDRLGPLARWARSEPKKPKAAAVTADDVRALIASLAVPAAIAHVSYPHGCRIRRVRVPAASDTDSSETTGPVILSRRALAEQRAEQ